MASRDSNGDTAYARLRDRHDTQNALALQEQGLAAREELLMIWDSLSPQGRRAVIVAARLTAHEEGLLPGDQVLR
ncbi:hypothetical protein [Roseomonas mucosa]|uniref:hypothetical protein n=1 Tax=Roseomonas mucosa TaxID=207340 RepID=UPI0012391304|nr:hypothetical protein [Roseomonas mucosa]MBS5904530.1 hypothetical protein [Acetobacteraceae bacterium]QET91501.1 hypothetical protein FOB66_00840 [Roseomonas mucosa]